MLVSIRLCSSLGLQRGLHLAPWREMMGSGGGGGGGKHGPATCRRHSLKLPHTRVLHGPQSTGHSAPRVLVPETDHRDSFLGLSALPCVLTLPCLRAWCSL